MSELESVIQLLESKGHRMTPARVAVVAAALANHGYFTAEDLLRQSRGVGRATVFRTLRLLLDEDVLCRFMLDDTTPRYRTTPRHGHHHHLVCVSCGSVTDFADCVDDLMSELGRRTDFAIEGHRLEVYGRCSSCVAGLRLAGAELAGSLRS